MTFWRQNGIGRNASPSTKGKPPGRLAYFVRTLYAIDVNKLHFEWDATKNRTNQIKHGISFEEAETAFSDEFGLVIHDPDHSDQEGRFILLGLTSSLRTIVVCHCYRSRGDVIRIFSARKANRREQALYYQR